ncbi:LysR family transcriptional regulator [Pantoea sp. DY-5]|uniref:LysR family transcriptional regulator n=1 Tax=Pantoea sp. DY-5 TaxID=2871488 RepID=UPI002106D13F|nr:LysR family transcriptional regulator [Pantoea sp. DY-5]
MELRHIRYFLMVAEERNFTRAAARLGIGQPPLSMQIRDLEKELKVSLFVRGRQGAELSEAGKAFYTAVKPMEKLAEEAIKSARRAGLGETGRLHLGFTGTAGVNPVVSATINTFKHRFPDVNLTVTEANSSDLIAELEAKRLDVALLRPATQIPQNITLSHLLEEKLVLALSDNHPLAGKRGKLDLNLLRSEPFILTPRNTGTSLREVSLQACHSSGFDPIEGQKAPHIVSILTVVAAALGVALVPQSMMQFRLAGVCFKQLRPPVPVIGLAAAWNNQNKSRVVENFLSIAVLKSCNNGAR